VMARQAVAEAQNEARRRSHNEVDTWHLLVALLAQEVASCRRWSRNSA